MRGISKSALMEDWLADVHSHVGTSDPRVLPLLRVYEGEARFGRQYIEPDIGRLATGATVLELGAGSLLLSCQLVREGYRVTALEPTGEGFSRLGHLRELVLAKAAELGCVPDILYQPAEEPLPADRFDYAFSINVMEHVSDVQAVIVNVGYCLRPAATYRFTCPNYLFPYEPHFNIPTLFSKRLTERIFRRRILVESTVQNASGVWNSLNWITVPEISRIVRQRPCLDVSYNKRFLVSTFERMGADVSFALRRSRWVRILILGSLKLRIHRLAGFVPVVVQPGIDCSLTRVATTGEE